MRSSPWEGPQHVVPHEAHRRRNGSSKRNSSFRSRRFTPTSFSMLARFAWHGRGRFKQARRSRDLYTKIITWRFPFTSALEPPICRISFTRVDIRVSISPTLQKNNKFDRNPALRMLYTHRANNAPVFHTSYRLRRANKFTVVIVHEILHIPVETLDIRFQTSGIRYESGKWRLSDDL